MSIRSSARINRSLTPFDSIIQSSKRKNIASPASSLKIDGNAADLYKAIRPKISYRCRLHRLCAKNNSKRTALDHSTIKVINRKTQIRNAANHVQRAVVRPNEATNLQCKISVQRDFVRNPAMFINRTSEELARVFPESGLFISRGRIYKPTALESMKRIIPNKESQKPIMLACPIRIRLQSKRESLAKITETSVTHDQSYLSVKSLPIHKARKKQAIRQRNEKLMKDAYTQPTVEHSPRPIIRVRIRGIDPVYDYDEDYNNLCDYDL